MNHKIYIIIILSFFVNGSISAQQLKIKQGEKHYEYYSYSKSVKKLEEITDKTNDMKRKLANSYFRMLEYEKSEKYYAEIINSEEYTAEDVYNYSKVLSINQKYDDADIWMRIFHDMKTDDTRGKLYIENYKYLETIKEDKGYFTINNLAMNTEQEDFGTSYYKDKIVFASSRTGIQTIKREWNWNNLPYLNMFIAETDDSLEFKAIDHFRKKLNKKFHEGPVAFNKAGDYMVFTRNNYKQRSSDGIIKLEMYWADYNKEKDKWNKPVGMHFNNKEYSVGHASLNAVGDTMYFASDMPGGIGGVDIYMTTRKEEGGWNEPQNLGKPINTEGNEMFPFLHEQKSLFFASDGNVGLGGLDIYVTNISTKGFSEPQNLGVPVNSSYDDFAFIIDSALHTGYFSSNRIEGHGDDDIYRFILHKPFFKGKLLRGTARDKKGNILASVTVNLYNNDGDVIGTIVTDVDGKYEFVIEQDKYYSLDGTKPKYTKGKNTANSFTDEYIVIADLELTREPEFSLYCLISDAKTKEPLDSVEITMINNITNETTVIKTKESGDFFRKLKGKKLNDKLSYTLLLRRKGYLYKEFNYDQVLYRPGQYNMHEEMNFEMHKLEIGLDLGQLVDINPIYFDLDRSNIRPDAAIELDKIVKVMNEYPDMVVELGSHTDCRGSKRYNQSLSQRRATSSAKYIKARISKPERIYGKGYGENKLVNKCECEGSIRVPCTDEEHQANRRTEFTIIKID